MLLYALLVSSAAALEISPNMTGSGTAQFQLSSTTGKSSEPQTVSEVVITLSHVSSPPSSPTKTSNQSKSPTITDGPIYTNDCNTDEGRNCDRLPEQPYWSGISPGNLVYGFTPTAQQNPWAYFLSFTESGQPSSALSSASSCSAAWYATYTTWLATADLTFSGFIPQSTAIATVVGETETAVSLESTTGTSVSVETDIFTVSGTAFTALLTDTEYEGVEVTSTSVQVATTETLIYTAYTAAFYPSYTWQAQPPCCSGCTIYAGDIEVLYFSPVTAIAGNETTSVPSTVVQSGFTFTSPSIYMALQTLAASDLCGPVGSEIKKATTLAFAQNELSTVPAYSMDGSLYTFSPYWQPSAYTPATFGTAACTSVTRVTGIQGLENVTVSYNPCFPYISIPPQVQTADPLWATCTSQWQFVLYDPPYVISHGTGIGEFSSSSATITSSVELTTSPALEITSSNAASTGPAVSAPTVTPTSSTASQPTISTRPPVQTSSTSVAADPATSTSPAVDPGNNKSSVGDPVSGATKSSVIIYTGTGPTTTEERAGGSASVPAHTSAAVITFGSSTVTANSASEFLIASTTLTLGGHVIFGGTTVSLASNGGTIVIESSTQDLITAASPTFFIGSQTLSAGGAPITVSGTTYSLQSGGASVVVGSITQPISALLGTSAPAYIIASGSQTLEAGASEITVSGTLVSLETGGSFVVIGGTRTEALSAFLGSQATSVSGLAGIIVTMGGFGTSTGAISTSSTGVSSFNGTLLTGSAPKAEARSMWIWGTILGVSIAVRGWL